jgi:hypothetical protein
MSKYFKHYHLGRVPKTTKWRIKKKNEMLARKYSISSNIETLTTNKHVKQINTNEAIDYSPNTYEYDESNPNTFDDTNNFNDPQELLKKIQIENEEENAPNEHNKGLIYSALLALFFSGNFTQSSFKLILEFTQLFTKIKIPSKFDQLLKTLGGEAIEYTKTWVCHQCNSTIELSSSNQRICSICSNR